MRWGKLKTVKGVLRVEVAKDALAWATRGRYNSQSDASMWWIAVAPDHQGAALDELKRHASEFGLQRRNLKKAATLGDGLKVLGLHPDEWGGYTLHGVPVLRFLSGHGTNSYRASRFPGAYDIPYLRGLITVRSPEAGSVVLYRGTDKLYGRSKKSVDRRVLELLAPFVEPGGVAHSRDGSTRYMFENGRLVSSVLDANGQTL
jgi:hypothetical protein